jgi:hypothetical protein
MKTPRAKMTQYMNSLKVKVGYSSLKTKFLESNAINFPSLSGSKTLSPSMDDDSEEVEGLFPSNPIEEKDKEIEKLKKELTNLAKEATENNCLKEALTKASAELKIAQNNILISQRKLDFTNKATEQKLIEDITSSEGYRADNILIGVYSATLDEDQIDVDVSKDASEDDRRSRKDIFLSMQKKLDPENKVQSERFQEVKNLILEKVKTTKYSRLRSRSFSTSSQGSKRGRSKDDSKDDRSLLRPRITNIPTKQS